MLGATCLAAGDATSALGTFWRGALGVMQTLVAAMNHHRLKNAQTRGQESMLQAPG
jgi:hypothetical protein